MLVTPAIALVQIQALAIAGRIRITAHARQRMNIRGATAHDIRHALISATSCRQGDNDEKYEVPSVDLDGDDLLVVVALVGDLLVVTVF